MNPFEANVWMRKFWLFFFCGIILFSLGVEFNKWEFGGSGLFLMCVAGAIYLYVRKEEKPWVMNSTS